VVRNSATGGFRVKLVTAAAGTNGVVWLGNGDVATVYSDGTNVVLVNLRYRPVPTLTTTATLLTISGDQTVLVNGTSGAWTLTLPDATKSNGVKLTIKAIDASGNLVTPTGASSQNIDGANTYTGLSAQYKFVQMVCNGTAWWIVGSN